MRPLFPPFSAFLILACLAGHAYAEKRRIVLDREGVRHYYTEGEFDKSIAILEDFQRTPGTWSREDSVMVYKYLGVMYSASPESREKGKTYFYKLIKVQPDARLEDMYVNTVVQDIFLGTLEYVRPSMPRARQEPAREKPAVAPKKSSNMGWWIGGVGLVAGVAGGYYWYGVREKPADSEIRAKVY